MKNEIKGNILNGILSNEIIIIICPKINKQTLFERNLKW